MKIVLITTTQPSANPRLVKEADAFCTAGYDVTVLYCYVADWAQMADKAVLKNVKWNYIQIGGVKKRSFIYQWTRLKYGIHKKINETFGENIVSEKAQARCYKELLSAAVKIKADYYIGHNPGAMAIAANAAKLNRANAGFDFEDYHRGEYSDAMSADAKRQVVLECKYISRFNYISAASKMIAQKIQKDFPNLSVAIITLLNCFPLSDREPFRNKRNDSLRLLWFSQHIGKGRGLESVITGLKMLNDPQIHITLVGNCTEDIKNLLVKLAGDMSKNIQFAGTIAPGELVRFASSFDIGLATELQKPLNRDICLTNKIFTYLLAGNAVILSDTLMQKDFNQEYRVGESYEVNNSDEFMTAILKYKDRELLDEQRINNYNLATSTFHWEKESIKLLDKISNCED